MEISELLDRAKEKADLPSDYALAKAMGIQTGIVANWRKGKRHPSNEEAVQLATLAGLNEMQVIAEIELRTANTEKKKEFWQRFLMEKGLAGTLGICALGIGIMIAPDAECSVLQLQGYATNQEIYPTINANGIYIIRHSR